MTVEVKPGYMLYFSEKPDETIRSEMKQLGFQWNKWKKYWYGPDTSGTRAFVSKLQLGV